MIRFTLPYPPSLNNLYSQGRGGKRFLTKRGKIFKAAAMAAAREAAIPCLACRVFVGLYVYRPRKAGDIDNSVKAIFDSISGIGWGDDKQVKGFFAWQEDDKRNPRVEVEITPLVDGERIRVGVAGGSL